METMEFSQQSEDSSVLIKNIYVQDGGMWVKINLPLSSDGIGELGEYLVELSDGKYLTRQRYVRVWDAERGFHYIHEELSFGLQKAPEIPWTQARLDLENEKIGVGDWGADSIILPLVCDVKNEKNPANYRVQLQIGSDPADKFWLQVDSGSSLLWVQSRLKKSDVVPAEHRRVFDVTRNGAATFVKGTSGYAISYGSHSKLQFNLYTTAFQLENVQAKQIFGAVPFKGLDDQLPIGILGLGFAERNSPVPYHKNLVMQLHADRQVKHASFTMIGPRSEPETTPYLNDRKEKNRGWFVIGTLDSKYHTGITWCNSFASTHRKWVVRLNKVFVNEKLVCENQLALIDTGCSYLVTGTKNLDAIAKEMQGQRASNGVHYPPGLLRSVAFVFGNSGEEEASFNLNLEDLSLGPSLEDPAMLLSPFVTTPSFDTDYPQDDYWVLGGIFLDNMITIFDYTYEKRIGFAAKSDVDPET